MNHIEIVNHSSHWKSTSLVFVSAISTRKRTCSLCSQLASGPKGLRTGGNVGILEMWNNVIKEFYQFKKAYLFFFPIIPLFQYSAIS
jgi:hypothetical protein